MSWGADAPGLLAVALESDAVRELELLLGQYGPLEKLYRKYMLSSGSVKTPIP